MSGQVEDARRFVDSVSAYTTLAVGPWDTGGSRRLKSAIERSTRRCRDLQMRFGGETEVKPREPI